jgi:hypothetical protein
MPRLMVLVAMKPTAFWPRVYQYFRIKQCVIEALDFRWGRNMACDL